MRMQDRKWIVWSLVVICFLGSIQGLAFAQDPIMQETPSDEGENALPDSNAVVVKSPFSGAKADERRQMDITLDNMDIYPVLDQVLGRILELNYVVDPAIKGTISLNIKGRYTKSEFLDLFNSILQIHGLAITRGAHDLYKVVRKASSARTGSEVVNAGEQVPSPGDVISVFQLQYLSAAHVIANLRNFISPGAVIVAEPSSNAVLLVDTAENVAKLSKILALMDTDLFKDIHWRFYSLEYTDVDDLSKDLDKIFKTKGLYMKQGIDPGGLQIMPLKTINAILVVTRWEEVLDVVGHWVTQLDQEISAKGTQVYVYFVQNGKAADIADLLRQLYGGKPSERKGKKDVIVEREKKPTQQQAVPHTGELAEEVEIIADEVNNAILIKATQRDYAILSGVLKEIDVVPRQVLIDVLIVEVTLDNELQYGVQWFLKARGINTGGEDMTADIGLNKPEFSLAEGGMLGSGLAGFSSALFSGGDLRALINLLASETEANIVSAPNILAVDNHESTIEVTRDEPTVSSSQTTDVGAITQTIQYRSVGIILNVTPLINESGLVTLEISQEVSNLLAQTTVEGIPSPVFQTRKATTNLVVQDSHTILIGGLMQTEQENVHTGIPFLKNLPILGYLFGSKGYATMKTELLFFITPHVIHTKEQADALTLEFSQKVKSLRTILEQRDVLDKEGDVVKTED
ncbi:MAG: type II secretion system secretin GspD [Deltaproteobacteria bacterium]|nr:type II secretion system secretin GspD [Deltaproteobacteria bacterium]MBW1931646.1 type II secretion system secretin GspD [Deltaproteobacteria bacterium]MBW2079507.1 type II secretion system secretin GspD [Deltaproteobacteria bacterium]MBW2349756.1 type II secretion system secretin GspD [Deltaproteobacteria bacterium]